MSLTLYTESSWMSPWVFHVLVALEELQLPYRIEVVPLPMSAERKAELQEHAVIGKVPVLVHDGVWISESLAITEYLAEAFPPPMHPAILPADRVARARARQVMSWLRTSLGALREYRPTSGVFGRPTSHPLTDQARSDAAELLRAAGRLVGEGKTSLFDSGWCIADTDLALALMRMVATQDPMPKHLVEYALAVFDRTSVHRYMAHLPTAP